MTPCGRLWRHRLHLMSARFSGVRRNSQRTRALRWGAHPDRRGRRPLVTGERGAVAGERAPSPPRGGATAGHRGAVIGWRGAITGERGAVPPSPAGRSCFFFNEESPNEVPDDYHVLNDVWNGPSRTIHINAYDSHLDQWFTNHLYEISGGADLGFFFFCCRLCMGAPNPKGQGMPWMPCTSVRHWLDLFSISLLCLPLVWNDKHDGIIICIIKHNGVKDEKLFAKYHRF